jgi:hypothetical protein
MKKCIALVVGTVGLLVLLAAGVAFAMVITGTNVPNNMTGTSEGRDLYPRKVPTLIVALIHRSSGKSRSATTATSR